MPQVALAGMAIDVRTAPTESLRDPLPA